MRNLSWSQGLLDASWTVGSIGILSSGEKTSGYHVFGWVKLPDILGMIIGRWVAGWVTHPVVNLTKEPIGHQTPALWERRNLSCISEWSPRLPYIIGPFLRWLSGTIGNKLLRPVAVPVLWGTACGTESKHWTRLLCGCATPKNEWFQHISKWLKQLFP